MSDLLHNTGDSKCRPEVNFQVVADLEEVEAESLGEGVRKEVSQAHRNFTIRGLKMSSECHKNNYTLNSTLTFMQGIWQ